MVVVECLMASGRPGRGPSEAAALGCRGAGLVSAVVPVGAARAIMVVGAMVVAVVVVFILVVLLLVGAFEAGAVEVAELGALLVVVALGVIGVGGLVVLLRRRVAVQHRLLRDLLLLAGGAVEKGVLLIVLPGEEGILGVRVLGLRRRGRPCTLLPFAAGHGEFSGFLDESVLSRGVMDDRAIALIL